MIIPIEQLSDDIIENIIEDFVLREGTDYGEHEVGFEAKKQQVIKQLKNGEIHVVYSELHETVNLMSADTFKS